MVSIVRARGTASVLILHSEEFKTLKGPVPAAIMEHPCHHNPEPDSKKNPHQLRPSLLLPSEQPAMTYGILVPPKTRSQNAVWVRSVLREQRK